MLRFINNGYSSAIYIQIVPEAARDIKRTQPHLQNIFFEGFLDVLLNLAIAALSSIWIEKLGLDAAFL